MNNLNETIKHKNKNQTVERRTNQYMLPLRNVESINTYNVYPAFQMGERKIFKGMLSLIEALAGQDKIIIDGYAGILWESVREKLIEILNRKKLKFYIYDTKDWYLPVERINQIVEPYIGEQDAVWGTRCYKKLIDLFDKETIKQCTPIKDADVTIVLGVGASLVCWNSPLVYLEMPKNEIQYRMRAGAISNLGAQGPEAAFQMYKRFYFVDWVLLNDYKKDILNKITIIADCQRTEIEGLTWGYMKDLKSALAIMSKNVFRVRPWFEPGVWGGQWIKDHIQDVNHDVVNYAWSFELITPENGLLFESTGLLLEISFDYLMFLHSSSVLGEEFANRFGCEFPIRFDFLDTVKGGNLSIQCHPSVSYIKEHFGEKFTQDETYYILDAVAGAKVYLGFQDNIDPPEFRRELEESNSKNVAIDVTKYVQCHESKKHDFFLIPNRTVHSAGAGNLVLEISATPYIFTFKMYDWVRLDLNGEPRPINISHAFNNLDFSRKGSKVTDELISKPYLLAAGEDWKQLHLPTHEDHFYDVHRYDFKKSIQILTEGSCNILMLVEGTSVVLETENGFRQRFYYAETFVIPSAARSYRLINEDANEVKVIKAFLKRKFFSDSSILDESLKN